jgi:hypothetical protein
MKEMSGRDRAKSALIPWQRKGRRVGPDAFARPSDNLSQISRLQQGTEPFADRDETHLALPICLHLRSSKQGYEAETGLKQV